MKKRIGELMSVAPWMTLDLSGEERKEMNETLMVIIKIINRKLYWSRRNESDKRRIEKK